MRSSLIFSLALPALFLAGCATSDQYVSQKSMKQLDASTYEMELQQPWVEQEIIVRENARKEATDFCLQTDRGMQPLSAISRSHQQTGNGAYVKFTFRCVGYVDGPKEEYHRLGFYTDEESKKEAIERNRKEYGY